MKKINGKLVSIGTTLVLIAGLVSWNYFGNSVTTAEEENLVKNGDMEAGNPPDNWRAGKAKLSAETEDAYSGKQSLKIDVFKYTNDYGKAFQVFKCEPGKTYRLEFMYKCGPSSELYICVSSHGIRLGHARRDNTWTLFEEEFTILAVKEACSANLGFYTKHGHIFIDDVIITEI